MMVTSQSSFGRIAKGAFFVATLAATLGLTHFVLPNAQAFNNFQGPASQLDPLQNAPQVINVTYTPAQTRLTIQVSRPNEVSVFNPVHEPQMKRFRFILTNAKIINGPTIIPVTSEGPVSEIRLTQTYSQKVPMVEVTMGLTSDSPQLSFDTQKILADGTFTVGIRQQPIIATTYAALSPNQMVGAPGYLQYPTSKPIMPSSTPWQQPYAPQQQAFNPVGGGLPVVANTIVWPLVKDIAVSANSIQIQGEQAPLQVERAFNLKGPERYVLDLTPAKLSPQLRNRLNIDDMGANHNVSSVRTSQLDDDTVRLVMTFKAYPLVVQMTPQNQNKSIKLSY